MAERKFVCSSLQAVQQEPDFRHYLHEVMVHVDGAGKRCGCLFVFCLQAAKCTRWGKEQYLRINNLCALPQVQAGVEAQVQHARETVAQLSADLAGEPPS